MDPSQTFTGLFTLPFWVLVIIIGLLVAGFRWIVENIAKAIAPIFPDKYEGWWVWFWREAMLPVSPLVFGGLIGYCIEQYPYPDVFSTSNWTRLFVGIIAGLFAAFCYPRIMYYLRKASKKWDVEANKVEKQLEEQMKE